MARNRAFSRQAPQYRNACPLELRTVSSLETFWWGLKTFFISEGFWVRQWLVFFFLTVFYVIICNWFVLTQRCVCSVTVDFNIVLSNYVSGLESLPWGKRRDTNFLNKH